MSKIKELISGNNQNLHSGEPVVGKSGLTKEQLLREILEDIYKTTPELELEREMPKKQSAPVQKTIVSGKCLTYLISKSNLI